MVPPVKPEHCMDCLQRRAPLRDNANVSYSIVFLFDALAACFDAFAARFEAIHTF